MLASTPPDIHWLVRDLASTGIFYSALIRDAVLGGATAAGLCESARLQGICSRGRVIAWVERAMACGLASVAAGSERWTQRPLVLYPRLAAEASRRLVGDCDSFALIAPELRAISNAPSTLALKTHLEVVMKLAVSRPDLMRGAPRPIEALMSTDGGAQLLIHFLADQPDAPSVLLAPAPLRIALWARHARISRLQVRRLLAIGEQAGLFAPGPERWLTPTPMLIDDFGWILAANLQGLRVTAARLPAGASSWREP